MATQHSFLLTMSLKRYLFIVIALFVLALAVIQLFFIHYASQQIAQEVSDKSRTLSKQALHFLADSLPDSSGATTNSKSTSSAQPVRKLLIHIQSTPNKVIDLGDDISFTSGNQTQTITLTRSPRPQITLFKQELQGQLEQVDFKQIEGTYAFSLDRKNNAHADPILTSRHIVQFDARDSSIKHYFNWLLIATIALTLAGLVFAYWLAAYLSQPLAELSKGFNKLQQGQLGTQIDPSGVAEIRATLASFNQMSARLAEINQLEKRLGQQQQLLELGDVARGLAHTLRNPLNTIGLAIEQISQTQTSQQRRLELATSARQKINHLDKTIKTLLHLTLQDLKRDEAVDLNQVIQDVIMEASMLSNVRVQFSPTDLALIPGAQVEIRAMLHTLLTNALEASNEQQFVEINVSQQQAQATIVIKDQGSGLAPYIKQQLFKPHVSSKAEGAGMGLYIASRICKLHYQGDLQLIENADAGCSAILILRHQDLRLTANSVNNND